MSEGRYGWPGGEGGGLQGRKDTVCWCVAEKNQSLSVCQSCQSINSGICYDQEAVSLLLNFGRKVLN